MVNIIHTPTNLWSFYKSNSGLNYKSNMYKIAENPEYGICIYMTENSSGIFQIIVEADDTEIYSVLAHDEKDCEKKAYQVYDDYLTANVIDKIDEVYNKSGEESNQSVKIEARESALDISVVSFLEDVVHPESIKDVDEDMVEDIKDHFLEYLFRKHGLDIYRPMILQSDDGKDFYEEYPYDCIEFEDKYNPIYK